MEKSFSREFSPNKNSWQLLLTSIINRYSLGHGKSCIVGHICVLCVVRVAWGEVAGRLAVPIQGFTKHK